MIGPYPKNAMVTFVQMFALAKEMREKSSGTLIKVTHEVHFWLQGGQMVLEKESDANRKLRREKQKQGSSVAPKSVIGFTNIGLYVKVVEPKPDRERPRTHLYALTVKPEKKRFTLSDTDKKLIGENTKKHVPDLTPNDIAILIRDIESRLAVHTEHIEPPKNTNWL